MVGRLRPFGFSFGGSIENSYATAKVHANSNYAGGLVGGTFRNPVSPFSQLFPLIANSYASGAISGNSGSGLVGLLDPNSSAPAALTANNNYAIGANHSMMLEVLYDLLRG